MTSLRGEVQGLERQRGGQEQTMARRLRAMYKVHAQGGALPLLFSGDDLEMMRKLKDVFNPTGMLNPGKVLPTGKICGELRVQVSA